MLLTTTIQQFSAAAMPKQLRKFFVFLFLFIGTALPLQAQAVDLIPNANSGTYINTQAQPCVRKDVPAGTGPSAAQAEDVSCTITSITNRIISIIFYLLGAIAVLVLIYAGIQYIQSNGSPEGTKKARGTITNTILGIIILIAAYWIINLIIGAVGSLKPAI